MGLDMYLTGEICVSSFGEKKNARSKISELVADHPVLAGKEVEGVTFDLAYWRKANAIHAWFVKHCQGGVDECQRTLVEQDQLADLVDTCKQVLADPSLAMELLPPQQGFFFGETDVGEWYFATLKQTVEMLEPLLDENIPVDFYYRSSW